MDTINTEEELNIDEALELLAQANRALRHCLWELPICKGRLRWASIWSLSTRISKFMDKVELQESK